VVVDINDLHNERNEGVDEDVSASFVVTPNLEEIQEFVGKSSFAVVVLEELQQLRGDLWRHLSYDVFIHSRVLSKCFNR
jgi:hypothetical protein